MGEKKNNCVKFTFRKSNFQIESKVSIFKD